VSLFSFFLVVGAAAAPLCLYTHTQYIYMSLDYQRCAWEKLPLYYRRDGEMAGLQHSRETFFFFFLFLRMITLSAAASAGINQSRNVFACTTLDISCEKLTRYVYTHTDVGVFHHR
jgi:hypothetical protein